MSPPFPLLYQDFSTLGDLLRHLRSPCQPAVRRLLPQPRPTPQTCFGCSATVLSPGARGLFPQAPLMSHFLDCDRALRMDCRRLDMPLSILRINVEKDLRVSVGLCLLEMSRNYQGFFLLFSRPLIAQRMD